MAVQHSIRAALGLAVLLAVTACGSGDEPAADKGAGSRAAESSSESTPAASASAASAASFEVKGMCQAIDRGLVKKIAGPNLGRDVSLKAGEVTPTGGRAQGFTCLIEGGEGRIEASVITLPEPAERRRNMPMPSGDGVSCVDVPSDAWDKSWDCKDQLGSGPILIRSAEQGIFTCYTNAKGPARAANNNGRALCDDLLEKVSG